MNPTPTPGSTSATRAMTAMAPDPTGPGIGAGTTIVAPSATTGWVLRVGWAIAGWLIRCCYRLRVLGREHLPETGGALLVANHPSLADPLFVGAAAGRYVRFLMHEKVYRRPIPGAIARFVGAIPLASEQRPRDLIKSLRAAAEAIRRGELVCIFPEGQVTRTGQLLPFRRGFERIMDGLEAPVIPLALVGPWGSRFSFAPRQSANPWFGGLRRQITVACGEPRRADARTAEVRQAVQELLSDAWTRRQDHLQPIHRGFVKTARRYPFRFAMGDQRAPQLNFLNALARTIYLARRLRPHWADQHQVGLLLPPSVGGALVNFAALLMGKVPVNLNYTASAEVIASCIRQCGIKTVISSQAFLEKVTLDLPFPPLRLEELAARPGFWERLSSLAIGSLLPVRWLERALGGLRPVGLHDLATVIFSSGSTGDPKGVPLSHFNLATNVAQLDQSFHPGTQDRFLGTLPFFHSFGFLGTLCLTGTLGIGVAYHPTPLDAEAVGRLVRDYRLTFLLSTPTFLQLYLRGCSAEDFGSLRVVLAGAEKLPERFATAFEDKFGIRPLEGYGCTECAPAIAVSTPGHRAAGFRQIGFKRGKIGHPLPGVSVRIVDPATREPLPLGQPGLMLVRGPNVMAGYLGRPQQTAEVLHGGWYSTGDIATMDEDGFLQITDRLSRFSKIGGEMVPHIKVEEQLQELTGEYDRNLVVTGVGDEKKGERLVVLHRLEQTALNELLAKMPQLDLPKLWVPKASQFFRVDDIPLLGSGKLDLRRVRELAQRCATP